MKDRTKRIFAAGAAALAMAGLGSIFGIAAAPTASAGPAIKCPPGTHLIRWAQPTGKVGAVWRWRCVQNR